MNLIQAHRFKQIKEASQSAEAWVTRDSDGTLTLSLAKPQRDRDFGWLVPKSSSSEKNYYMFLKDSMFPQITGDDKEPTQIRLMIG